MRLHLTPHLICLLQCTKTCGEGSRYRQVVCVAEDQSEVHSTHCDSDQRPPDRESCSLQPCEYLWITGEWSEVLFWGICGAFSVGAAE